MKHLFIPYELAVIAKEKGFNEPCFGNYRINKTLYETHYTDKQTKEYLLAPIYQQIDDFLLSKGFMVRISYNGVGYELRALEWGEHEYKWFDSKDKAIEEAFKLI